MPAATRRLLALMWIAIGLFGCSEDAAIGERDTGASVSGRGGSDSGTSVSGQGGNAPSVSAPRRDAGGSGSRDSGTNDSGTTRQDRDAGDSGSSVPIPNGARCEDLPTAGTWQDITPHGNAENAVNGTVAAAVVVDPFDPRTVWLGTGGQNDEIWRSDDCGASWTQVNTGPGSVGDGMTYGGVGDGAQWSMMVDPVDPGVLYAVSGYGAQSLWKSIDGGQSWTDLLSDTEYGRVADYRFVNNVSMDPNDHRHLVVSTHGGCAAPYAPSCIAETHDGGDSFRVLTAPEGWTEGGGLVIVDGDRWIWCGSSLMRTDDAGASWSPGLEGGGSCEAEYTIRPFAPAATGTYYIGSRNGVVRSHDGWNWEHVPGTTGNMVMVTLGSTHVFAANQWSASLQWAPLSDDEHWTDLPAPPQISQGTDNGIPFLAYDDAHRLVYAALFSGGVARMVVP